MNLNPIALALAVLGLAPMPRLPRPYGPGRRTIYTLHRGANRSRYVPHQGAKERARRRRQLGTAA